MFFQFALDQENNLYGALEKKIIKHVIMSDKEMDADKRHRKWVHDYWLCLEKANMANFDQKYPKEAVRSLVEGIRPLGLREAIKSDLKHDKKYLRSNVTHFINYVLAELRAMMKFLRGAASLTDSKESEKKSDVPKGVKSLKESTPIVDAMPIAKVLTIAPAAAKTKKKTTCWHCSGPHRLEKCTTASAAEKVVIRSRKEEEWATSAKNTMSKPPTVKAKALRTPADSSSTHSAMIAGADGVGVIPALFDSGSDPTALISRGLLETLQQTKLDVSLTKAEVPLYRSPATAS